MAQVAQNPIIIVEGAGFWYSRYDEMKNCLARVVPEEKVFILPVTMLDWIGFPPSPEKATNRIMKMIDETIEIIEKKYPGEPITIVAHSGGGTVAMIYMLGKEFQGDVFSRQKSVKKLITLGTPFHSHESYGKVKSDFIVKNVTPEFFNQYEVISIVSDPYFGKLNGSLTEAACYYFYKSVSGQGELSGDGIVTVKSCFLDGARNIIIRGVEHLPTPMTKWYGAKEGVQQWQQYL
ncbi:MAG: alpha/beta hydrolase [Chlorobiales bacterium]|nr:alpha/beta hydrolase [Chlorobiales bacterium]